MYGNLVHTGAYTNWRCNGDAAHGEAREATWRIMHQCCQQRKTDSWTEDRSLKEIIASVTLLNYLPDSNTAWVPSAASCMRLSRRLRARDSMMVDFSLQVAM